jgi:hypothetical protein
MMQDCHRAALLQAHSGHRLTVTVKGARDYEYPG